MPAENHPGECKQPPRGFMDDEGRAAPPTRPGVGMMLVP